MSPADSAQDKLPAVLPAPPRAPTASIALFVDVDGTLVDFAERPDGVVVEPSLKPTLRELVARLDGALAAISGRPLREIDSLLELSSSAAAGMHGAELRTADGRVLAGALDPSQLDAVREMAARVVAAHPGVLIEDKGTAIALHYRMAPDAEADVQRVAVAMLQTAGADFELLQGNHVVELKPAQTNKGTALASLMRSYPFAGRTPWVVGDDLTDEDAFERANALGGVSVIVGARRPTLAQYALADPMAARAWIASLVASEAGA